MRIKRINLTEFDPDTMKFPTDYITVAQFLQDPEIKMYYDPLATIQQQRYKRMTTTKYAYELED